MVTRIQELREIAEEAKSASAWDVRPIIERFVDKSIDTIEQLTEAVERLQGGECERQE